MSPSFSSYKLILCILLLQLSWSYQATGEDDQVIEECPRFCPEDVRAAHFHPIFRNRVEILQLAFTQALNGVQQLQSDMAGKMAGKLTGPLSGLTDTPHQVKERIENLKILLEEEVEMAVRVNRRSWNRIKDTHADLMDKNRSPKAPKYPPDMQTEMENLIQSMEETEKSFSPLVAEIESNMGKLLNPMSALLMTMAKAGGVDSLTEKLGLILQSKPDNFVGRVLLKLVAAKLSGETVGPAPPLLGESLDLARGQKERFFQRVVNPPTKHRMGLEAFWRRELESLERKQLENVDDAALDLIVAIISAAKL